MSGSRMWNVDKNPDPYRKKTRPRPNIGEKIFFSLKKNAVSVIILYNLS